MSRIDWVQHAGVYPLKSRCGKFQVACYIGSGGPRYLAWYMPRPSAPQPIDPMCGTLEEARLQAEEFAMALPARAPHEVWPNG